MNPAAIFDLKLVADYNTDIFLSSAAHPQCEYLETPVTRSELDAGTILMRKEDANKNPIEKKVGICQKNQSLNGAAGRCLRLQNFA